MRQDDTIDSFKSEVQKEDTFVKSIELFESNGKARSALAGTDSLYSALKDSPSKVYLSVNGMEYEFDRETDSQPQVLLGEPESALFQKCQESNLSKMHSSTISTIMQQVQKNLPAFE